MIELSELVSYEIILTRSLMSVITGIWTTPVYHPLSRVLTVASLMLPFGPPTRVDDRRVMTGSGLHVFENQVVDASHLSLHLYHLHHSSFLFSYPSRSLGARELQRECNDLITRVLWRSAHLHFVLNYRNS